MRAVGEGGIDALVLQHKLERLRRLGRGGIEQQLTPRRVLLDRVERGARARGRRESRDAARQRLGFGFGLWLGMGLGFGVRVGSRRRTPAPWVGVRVRDGVGLQG